MGLLPSLSLLSLFILSPLLTTTTTTVTAQAPPPVFKCTAKSTCTALAGYVSPNTTTLGHIQSLFQLPSLLPLLGANGLPSSTPSTHKVPQNSTVRIPFPCRCTHGSGFSDHVPSYVVVKNDGLFHIASGVFSGLMAYQQIQTVNNITDANLIYVGQTLWIPLPCSCDDVDGQQVVHYAHVVAPNSTVNEIAKEFDTTSPTLMRLNGISDPRKLIAGQVLDVPLKACSSSDVQTSSPADSLLAANGTYIYTANNCSKCTCDAANDYKLQCQPSGLKPANGSTCTGTEAAPPPGKNGAWKVEQVSWSWAIVLVSIQLCRFL
ncbi:hypothetical protein Cgig2_019409 [Carnegiea gigantea]|uniref:LysM domain-containing protein n=1 Tax=Carnegiea gigantea TaxID=171969 RepID=A0A9Q1KQT8_9CARY|nr:hypothetical protein Cgig2_019409 [Carnegiea gigantea]